MDGWRETIARLEFLPPRHSSSGMGNMSCSLYICDACMHACMYVRNLALGPLQNQRKAPSQQPVRRIRRARHVGSTLKDAVPPNISKKPSQHVPKTSCAAPSASNFQYALVLARTSPFETNPMVPSTSSPVRGDRRFPFPSQFLPLSRPFSNPWPDTAHHPNTGPTTPGPRPLEPSRHVRSHASRSCSSRRGPGYVCTNLIRSPPSSLFASVSTRAPPAPPSPRTKKTS